MADLSEKTCKPCEGGVAPLDEDATTTYMAQIHPNWELDAASQCIVREYSFKNYYQTIAFVNAVAWVAHQEDHHPDLEVSYNRCTITYSTHAINGLSENDFICAAKIDNL